MLAPLDLVVLVTLTQASHRSAHGYDLLQTIRESHGIDAATTSLYRALRQLRARGLLDEVPLRAGDDPRRRRYRITTAGIAAVAAERARLIRLFGSRLRATGAQA
jgi:DNA-binding PadR family transcriptional regulator